MYIIGDEITFSIAIYYCGIDADHESQLFVHNAAIYQGWKSQNFKGKVALIMISSMC